MDELTGNWITDENGILDEDAGGDTWPDCLGAGGELDRQAADEAIEDMQREDAKGFKTLTTRWDKRWRMKDGEWKMKVVGREYKWAEHREDLFSPGATHSASRVVDFLELKMGLETFEADAVVLTTRLLIKKKWWWNLRRSTLNDLPKLEGTQRSCGELGGTRGWNSCVMLGFVRCATAPQFYWSSERMVALELHMDDLHGAATPSGRDKVVKDLALEINQFQGKPHEHLKRLRLPMTGETRVQPNPKHPESVLRTQDLGFPVVTVLVLQSPNFLQI